LQFKEEEAVMMIMMMMMMMMRISDKYMLQQRTFVVSVSHECSRTVSGRDISGNVV
jgi:hypothetical protein